MTVSYFEVIGPVLVGSLANSPLILAWIVGIILSVRMFRRERGKAEKLLLAGCSLMLLAQLIKPFLTGIVILLMESSPDLSASQFGLRVSLISGLPVSILNMAGIICLVLAFWTRWKVKTAKG